MKRFSISAAIALLAVGSVACAEESADVKIGIIVSLTGSGAPYGNSIQRGVELAIGEINAAGGMEVFERGQKPITVVTRDVQSDGAVGVQAAREMIDSGVVAAIGADVSDVTLAIAPLFQAASVVLMSPSSSAPKISDAGDFIYRNYPSDELEALNTADHIFNATGLREAAIIAQQTEFGLGQKNSFIQRFRMLGGREIGQESYPATASEDDFARIAQSIEAADPPAVYIAGYTPDTAAVARALRAAGSDAALFATSSILPAELQESDFADVEGLQFPLASWDPQSVDENVRRFVAVFQGQYGMEPDVYAAHGYDAMSILALAIREAGLDPQELRFYLNGMNPYPGVTGSTDFDDKGDVRKFHRMYEIRNGVAVSIE
jgi:branched-chain amino acid transport system substrate-binding protein